MPQILKFAIVGVGCIGLEHIRNIALLDTACVVAVVDTSADMLRGATHLFSDTHPPVKQYPSLDALIDDIQGQLVVVDAIVLATPNFSHLPLISAVFRRTSAHLLIEKPLCTTVEDCLQVEAMQKADAHKESRVVWVGMEYRFMPSIARLIQEVDIGTIGAPKMLSIREHRFPFLRKVGHWNRFNRYSGGTLVEKCCHFFDLMRRIIKAQPVRVIASGAQDVEYKDEGYLQQAPGLLLHVRDVPGVSAAAAEKAAETAEKAEEPEKPDIIDNAFVIVEFENGVRAMLDLCMFAENSLYQEEVSLVGTLGKAEAFGSKHGEKEADEALVNFRLGLRPRSSSWSPSSHEPPPVDLLPPLTQQHVGVSDKKLMEAGAHEGSTFHEVRLFCEAIAADADVRAAALRQLVSVEDGRWAVAMGVAAQESIARGGMPVSILDPYA